MTQTNELVFLPLGGCNEVGMNLNAYGFGPPEDRKWLLVDVGVTFGREEQAGVDLITPDPEFLEQHKDDILAVVMTHAHEDHIGAIGWLWPRLKAPIYATAFTAELVRGKLSERGVDKKATVHVIQPKVRLSIGPFEIEFISLTHSIPEMYGLAIRTPLGLVWHTGDWKIDADPLIGDLTDETRVRALGDDGVLAMMCDSTNVFVDGESGSESDVRKGLIEVVARAKGRVAVTAFASNVARITSAIEAARLAGRSVCLVGRSMHKIVGAATKVGILKDLPKFVGEEEAAFLDPREIMLLCTGSQGEAQAALGRIASNSHRHVTLSAGDMVIFSSRMIPGNEAPIQAIQSLLVDRGVQVITDRDAHVHVSGHPCRDELKRMYEWARPQIAVPVHGERRHIVEHVAFANALQIPQSFALHNGEMLRLAPGPAAVIDEVASGRLFVDGNLLIQADDEAIRDRKRLGSDGQITISLAVSGKKHTIVAGPDVRVRGLTAEDEKALEAALEQLADTAEDAFHKLSAAERSDPEACESAMTRTLRKAAERIWGKRPFVDIVVLQV
ncbi:MAG: ribonuclease J [Caulobacterales bacterium]|jgi:ribonuclease J